LRKDLSLPKNKKKCLLSVRVRYSVILFLVIAITLLQ
jgi:hypothetical protein